MTSNPRASAAFWVIGVVAVAAALPLQAQTPVSANAATAHAVPASAPLDANGADSAPTRSPAQGVDANYRISPNDLMEFDVFGVPDMKRDVRVNASGEVSLPLIGQVPVAGLTAQAAARLIADRYKEKYLQDPQVSLFIKEFTTQRIAIEGAVLKPGVYPMTGQLTLLRALALSGGFAPYADINKIVVYRHGAGGAREQFTYDLDKVRAGQEVDPNIRADDVIVIQRNARRTALRDSLFSDILNTLNPFN
ncbi:polysaccharide biosynthesis/export family protein [Hydrogenophaga sp.]|uniref:polysaccharide biosynthesis/export family protein n=1 Tax=Hydrogenophaga sp. TaxID=1904254 RepID=UPI0025C21AB2|nr:polysaccharide biosynthesis/export family protein [Hydrogenophaga sp.]MBT9463783.1 polysaccharide export protein [Hydrogenophaga sp.]